jgi:hypothetical protein
MRHHTLLVATAVLISATLVTAAEAGQRQRSPNREGGGRHNGNSGAPAAAPRERGGDRGDRGNQGGGGDRGVRDTGRREVGPPPQARTEPAPEAQQGEPRGERAVPRSQGGDRRDVGRVETRDGRRTYDGNRTVTRTYDGNRAGTRTYDGSRAGARTYEGNRVVTRGADGGRVESRNYGDARYSGHIAVPRVGPVPQRRDGRYAYGGRNYSYGGRSYYYAPRYYYSPRYYAYRPYYFYQPGYYTAFTFGFGPRGRGFFYFDSFYDSYVFYPHTVVRYGETGRYGYPTGNLRLDIEPRDAQVYIDGAYAGLVDDFDGVFQSIRLEAGEYHVEVVLPGFESLEFDVRIFPGEKTTYRGDLLPERP